MQCNLKDYTFGQNCSCKQQTARQQHWAVPATGTKAVRKSRQASEPVPAEREQVGNQSLFASGKDRLTHLVDTLLYGAASRIERGTSVCVCCRGTGSMACKECGGKGLLSGKQSRHQAGSSEFMMSNRCRRCRGYGRFECNVCDGLGKRFIAPIYDD